MPKLVEFPKQNKDATWGEAMAAILQNADEATKNKSVKTLLVIAESDEDYSFGISNGDRVRNLLGTLECVKACLVAALHDSAQFDYPN